MRHRLTSQPISSERKSALFGAKCARYKSTYDHRSGASRIRTLMRMDFPTMHLFHLNHTDRNRIVDVLLHYYRLHIPQFPELKSLSVLQELWAD